MVVPWTRWAVPGEQVLLAAAAGRSCRVSRASSLQVRPELSDPPPAQPSDWRGHICRRTRTSRWGWKAQAPAWRTPSRLLPRRAAAASSGRVHEAHRAHGAPAASAPDTGTGLMAGSISTGSHDGDSPGSGATVGTESPTGSALGLPPPSHFVPMRTVDQRPGELPVQVQGGPPGPLAPPPRRARLRSR